MATDFIQHSKSRLEGFMDRAQDETSLLALIRNRTMKTTKPDKLRAWAIVLGEYGFKEEAKYAQKKLGDGKEEVSDAIC